MRRTNPISRHFGIATILPVMALLLGLFVVGLPTASAVIVQDSPAGEGEHYLAFELEDYDSIEDINGDGWTWEVVSNPNASGGTALKAGNNGDYDRSYSVTDINNPSAEATYELQFTTADWYDVYVRYVNYGDWITNAHYFSGDRWASNSFFTEPTEPHAVRVNWMGYSDLALDDPLVPQYFYDHVGQMLIAEEGETAPAAAAHVGEVVEFKVGIHTGGVEIDRIVMVDQTDPGIGAFSHNYVFNDPADSVNVPLWELDAIPNTEAGIAGDFDGDSDVDGADFLLWQRDNNVGDLSDWQTNYGTASAAGTAAVPEPGSCVLLLVGGLVAMLKRRRG